MFPKAIVCQSFQLQNLNPCSCIYLVHSPSLPFFVVCDYKLRLVGPIFPTGSSLWSSLSQSQAAAAEQMVDKNSMELLLREQMQRYKKDLQSTLEASVDEEVNRNSMKQRFSFQNARIL